MSTRGQSIPSGLGRHWETEREHKLVLQNQRFCRTQDAGMKHKGTQKEGTTLVSPSVLGGTAIHWQQQRLRGSAPALCLPPAR